MIYFESNIHRSPTARAYLNHENCQIAVFSYVDRCDAYGIKYCGETEGAMVVIPDMFGSWAIGYFIGPEYIINNNIRFATEEELAEIAASLGIEII